MYTKINFITCTYIVDVDHVSESDIDGDANAKRRTSKFEIPNTFSTSEDSEMELFSAKAENSHGGINFYHGKTSRWHRPKRIQGTLGYKNLIQTYLCLTCTFIKIYYYCRNTRNPEKCANSKY